jgi:hypothetical protein
MSHVNTKRKSRAGLSQNERHKKLKAEKHGLQTQLVDLQELLDRTMSTSSAYSLSAEIFNFESYTHSIRPQASVWNQI